MEEESLMSAATDYTHRGQEMPLVGKKKVEEGRYWERRCRVKQVPSILISLPMNYRSCWLRKTTIAVVASLGLYSQAGSQLRTKLTTNAL